MVFSNTNLSSEGVQSIVNTIICYPKHRNQMSSTLTRIFQCVLNVIQTYPMQICQYICSTNLLLSPKHVIEQECSITTFSQMIQLAQQSMTRQTSSQRQQHRLQIYSNESIMHVTIDDEMKWFCYRWQICNLLVLLQHRGASANFCLILQPAKPRLIFSQLLFNEESKKINPLKLTFCPLKCICYNQMKDSKPTRVSANASTLPKDSNLVKSAPRGVITKVTGASKNR